MIAFKYVLVMGYKNSIPFLYLMSYRVHLQSQKKKNKYLQVRKCIGMNQTGREEARNALPCHFLKDDAKNIVETKGDTTQ